MVVSFEVGQTAGQDAIYPYVTPEGRGRGRPAWPEVSKPTIRRWWIACFSLLRQSPCYGHMLVADHSDVNRILELGKIVCWYG